VEALRELKAIKNQFKLITCPHEMGGDEASALGFEPLILGAISKKITTAEDTRRAAREMLDLKVDLLVFAGGDGTARDIYTAVGDQIPSLGIPAGVKIHSSVFATNPKNAGILTRRYLAEGNSAIRLIDGEVMDVDEMAYREGRIDVKLYGFLKIVSTHEMIQDVKVATPPEQRTALEAIAVDILEIMQDDVLYIVGPGTTTKAILDRMEIKSTLLGVDAVLNRKLVGSDLNEAQLLSLIHDKKTKIIVSVIGRQGYVFGRGNQQISPDVIRWVGKVNIIVAATKEKLLGLGRKSLMVDTGDPEVDEILRGYVPVFTGFGERVMLKLTS
jgi:predicted polyphosphate/ATP-dependent NAD kinase